MNLLELFAPIGTFIFEVDGVLADEVVSITAEGQTLRHMSMKDIYALRVAVAKGYKVWLVTTGKDEWLNELRSAGVGAINRTGGNAEEVLQSNISSVPYSEILYMGSDIDAYEAMRLSGLPVCPANAVAEIKQVAKYVSPYDGGKGCVRDVIEKVLKLNGHWELPG